MWLNSVVAAAIASVLTWTAPTKNTDGTDLTDLTGYAVLRSCDAGPYGEIGQTAANVLTYTDSIPANCARASYVLQAIATSGRSAQTNSVSKDNQSPGQTVAGFDWNTSAPPAFGVDATSHGAPVPQVSGTTQTWSHTTCVCATMLLVTLGSGSGDLAARTVTMVTFNNVALTRVAAADDGNFERAEIWKLANPPACNGCAIVVTYGGQPQMAGGAISFKGSSTIGTPATKTALLTANPNVTVPSAAGDIVVSVHASDLGPVGPTTPLGTAIYDDEDIQADSDFSAQYQTATTTSTVAQWTAAAPTGGGWAVVGVAVH